MALKIDVKPGERIFLGTSSFVMSNESTIAVAIDGDLPVLRETDYLWSRPNQTSVRDLYCVLQSAYLADLVDVSRYVETVGRYSPTNPTAIELLQQIKDLAAGGNLYTALKVARKLVLAEEKTATWSDVIGYWPEGYVRR